MLNEVVKQTSIPPGERLKSGKGMGKKEGKNGRKWGEGKVGERKGIRQRRESGAVEWGADVRPVIRHQSTCGWRYVGHEHVKVELG